MFRKFAHLEVNAEVDVGVAVLRRFLRRMVELAAITAIADVLEVITTDLKKTVEVVIGLKMSRNIQSN